MGKMHTETLAMQEVVDDKALLVIIGYIGRYTNVPIIQRIMKNGIYFGVRIVIMDSRARPLEKIIDEHECSTCFP
jgi:hypothetical protein